jgi:hypothetical protein
MAKALKVTKEDGTIHIVPISNKASLTHQNNLRPANRKWTLEEIDEKDAQNLPWKDKEFVPASAKAVVDAKNAEIAELLRKLAEAEAKAKNGSNDGGENAPEDEQPKPNLSTSVNATEAIAVIGTLATVEEVNAYINGDSRATVVKAANAKIAELETK